MYSRATASRFARTPLRLGDWLGVVPHVVTLDAAIGHDDAAVLCEHFWTGIGQGAVGSMG